MLQALGGVANSKTHTYTGRWELDGKYDRGIQKLEDVMSEVSSELCFLAGVTLLTVDDDHLRMRSLRLLGMLSLSSKTNPSKAVGPVQTTLHDPLLGFWLAGRYAKKGEACTKSLLKCLMNLTGESFPENVTLTGGRMISIDRGYVTPDLIQLFN